ncbi:MAG: hypothetical protein LKJ88_04885 [Bacilli bacterium]|jgi:NitT/TauT family transport system substrate-binding protein|nr:hypothetical protein [Bacilli bacterium]
MKKSLWIVPFLSFSLLASCGEVSSSSLASSSSLESLNSSLPASSSQEAGLDDVTPFSFKAICPKGAPSMAFTPFLKGYQGQLSFAAPANVRAAFATQEYGAVVFDLNVGAKLIKANSFNYKLAGVLTKGNVFIISTGKDANKTLEEGDKIVSFGTNSLFTGIFKKVYNVSTLTEVSDVSVAYTVADTGLNNGEDVDYVLLSEPMVTKLMLKKATDSSSAPLTTSIYANLTEKWQEYSKEQKLNNGLGYDGFPQAGIFISKTLEDDQTKKAEVSAFLDKIAETGEDFELNQGKKAIQILENDTSSGLYKTEDVFNLPLNMIKSIVNLPSFTNSANPFGFNPLSFKLNDFLSDAKITGFPSIDTSLFSSYFPS